MSQVNKYKKIKKNTIPVISSIWNVIIELFLILKKWIIGLIDLNKEFYYDIRYNNNTIVYKIASVTAFFLVVFIFIFLPIKSYHDWIKWKWRDLKINYNEYQIPNKTQIEEDIQRFTKEYSDSFGIDCSWFKNHDVDIAMYEKYGRLSRPSYECSKFTKEKQLMLFPISIWIPKGNNKIITVDAKLGKIYYNQEGATQYTTINAKLWRLKDEQNILRIDKMDNIQRHDF